MYQVCIDSGMYVRQQFRIEKKINSKINTGRTAVDYYSNINGGTGCGEGDSAVASTYHILHHVIFRDTVHILCIFPSGMIQRVSSDNALP